MNNKQKNSNQDQNNLNQSNYNSQINNEIQKTSLGSNQNLDNNTYAQFQQVNVSMFQQQGANYNIKTPNEKNQDNVYINNMINNASSLDEKLLIAYIGNNQDKILNGKFNFAAMFLSYFYAAYRKYYPFTIVLYLISTIISIISVAFGSYYDNPAIGDTFMYITYIPVAIFTGFKFNKMYVNYAKKNINKIRNENPNITDEELCDLCRNHGKPSVAISILSFIVFVIAVSVIRMLITGVN